MVQDRGFKGYEKLWAAVMGRAIDDCSLMGAVIDSSIQAGIRAYLWITSDNPGISRHRRLICQFADIPEDKLIRRVIEDYGDAYRDAIEIVDNSINVELSVK